ncbi:PhoX family phosphatase [Cupriavidus sp. AU9028]|uniref:PhoX family protein n=1 Tax=Cupriavidus sp. AU9028 TaxID=2871157 RepID=UPI001C95CE35|nr:PhoX family phosphatase [Cupriavidus sp. AU9028]MBY4898485.1 PhoX family phosphatase [Cupriavidus sp. AU9028]
MSYLTDKARAKRRAAEGYVTVPGKMLEDIVAANPERRKVLRGGLSLSLLSVFGSTSLLAACGGDDDNTPAPAPAPAPGPVEPAPLDYSIRFTPVGDKITADTVTVPENYTVQVLFSAGDPVEIGSVGYTGTPLSSAETERLAGGQHDGMHFFEIPGVDPLKGGLLAINHENLDSDILFGRGVDYDEATATAEQKRLALSHVGVSIIEVQFVDGKWEVKRDSRYNKRYTGNSLYRVSGPAASVVGTSVVGTLNNCSSGHTPWGTYLTCEETTDNYLDTTKPDEGYGWVVEIDPLNELGAPTKRTAMGRFSHENTAFMTDANNRVAFYMGDDGTPGCIYKFVPNKAFDPANRAANLGLLDDGVLYVAKFNGDGTGQWIELTQGKNNLTVGASDPGNWTQSAVSPAPTTFDFNSQADVLLNTHRAARVAGGTLMDRPEWITVGLDKAVFCTLTNNGGRRQTDAANPRATNPHGHIIRWTEDGNSPLATSFKWEIFLLAGDPSLAADNLKGNIVGDTFSSPDGIRVDPKGRLWVQTDAGTGASTTDIFGANSMHYVDQETRECKRFLVGPQGCEITGIAYTPDLTTFFINIQHPTNQWPSADLPARSSTIVVRHKDGLPIGA